MTLGYPGLALDEEGLAESPGKGLLDNWIGNAFHLHRNEGVLADSLLLALAANGPDAILEMRKDILLTVAV